MIRPHGAARGALASALGLALAACGGAPPGTGGRVEARWTGATSGRVAAAGTGTWCPDDSTLHLLALRGDTGFALLIRPRDSLAPGRYPVMPPAAARIARPAAAAALRSTGPGAIVGYRSSGGSVTLERAGPRLAGSFRVQAGAVTLRGGFVDVPVRTGGPECAR